MKLMIGLIMRHMTTIPMTTNNLIGMQTCEVGLFRLPGLKFNVPIEQELSTQMQDWSEKNKCGTYMTDRLWSFRNERQREWFILRWADEILKSSA